MPGYSANKVDHLNRLSRIEGQIRGIARMVDEEKYCIDVLTQVAAASRAAERRSRPARGAPGALLRRRRRAAPGRAPGEVARGIGRDRPTGAQLGRGRAWCARPRARET